MERKGRKSPPKNPTPDRKSPPGGNTLVWYLVGVTLLTLVVVSLFGTETQVKIPIGELYRLIQQGSPDKHPKASIDVVEGAADKETTVRYSNLADVRIGPLEVTGTVTREMIAPHPEKAKTLVPFRTDRLGVENDQNGLFNLLQEHGFRNVSGAPPPSLLHDYIPTIVMAALLVALVFFMLRKMGGTGSAIAFGRSRGKLHAQEEMGVTFDEVAGVDEAVEELREVVDFLKTPEKYQVLGGRIPRGVLLVGPPGTGKTLLAKAVAGEAGVPFFSLSGSDFVEMFVGVGAARVRDMFEQAKAKAPCIVFIDELDALGKTRGTNIVGGDHEREQTLNALLVEMDGFTSNSGVIVMAATNRPETLDPALLRPGRFDRHVLVDRPDVRGREAILEVHGGAVRLDRTVDLKDVARITSGFVGADLANLVNEAALLAARAGKPTVTMQEFNEGVDRVVAGLEKRQRVMHADEKRRVAYHESAHALVAASLPNTDPVHKVSIIPRGLAALGYTMHRPEGDRYLVTQSELESRIQVLLAGTVAEEFIFGDISTGAQSDLERATDIARSMVMDFGMSRLGRVAYRESRHTMFFEGQEELHGDRAHSEQTAREIDEEIRRILAQSLDGVRHVLETRRQALCAIADCLIEQETIDNGDLKRIIDANSPSPMIVPGTGEASLRKPAAPAPVVAVEESAPRQARAEGAG
jgi:cell division protease FtsH